MRQSPKFMNKANLAIQHLILEKRYQLMKDHRVNILGLTNLKMNIKLQESREKHQSAMMAYGWI